MPATYTSTVGIVQGLERKHRRSVLACLAACGVLLQGSSARAEEDIRIAVARLPGPVSFSGTDLKAEDIVTAQVLASGKRVITVGAGSDGLMVLGRPTRAHRVIVTGDGGVSYQGRAFRGVIEVLYHRVKGRPQVLVVHPLPIERYLVGILAGELPSNWPLETMKAQAVAARTYAVYQKFHAPDRPYHMESGVLDQVYGGVQRETPDARAAVAATAGQVLTWRRRPIRAYFHACCAGHTESAREGWGTPLAYLPGSTCGFCNQCSRFSWQFKASLKEVGDALTRARVGVGTLDQVSVSKRTGTGRAAQVKVHGSGGTRTLHGEDLRRILGYDRVRSRHFDIKLQGQGILVTGKGSGHAVGLCQWGARGMAQAGKDYKTILERYYPGTRLQKMY